MAARDGLILKFSTDLLPAQKSIQDFALNGVSMLSSLGRKAIETEATLKSMGTVTNTLVAAAGAFAAFEAVKFTLQAVGEAAKAAEAELGKLVKIGTDAQGLGVGTTFFQQFTEGSKKMGLEAEDLTKILESLKNQAMVSLGTGDDTDPKSAAQNAISAEIQAGNLNKGDNKAFDSAGSQEERLKAALALIAELQAKGAQLAAFDLGGKLFGTDFETNLRTDSDLVAKLQQRVQDMANGKGVNVVPPEQIEAAREIQAQIEDMDQRIQNALIPFHNDLRGWQQEELNSVIQLKEYWTEVVEVFGKLWTWADSIKSTIASWGNASFFAQVNKMLDAAGLLGQGAQMFRDKDGNITTLTKAREAGTEPPAPDTGRPLTITRPRGDTSKPLPDTKDKAGADKTDQTDPVANYIDELKKSAAAELAEAQTLGLNDKAKQEAIDLAKAKAIADKDNRTLTEDESKQVLAQADAYAAAKVQIDTFNRAQASAKEQAQFLGQQFESSVEKMALGGGKLRDVMLDVVKALEEAALKALILGEGPLAGLFGTASGGVNGEGKGYGGLGGLLGGATSLFKGIGGGDSDAARDAAQDAAMFGGDTSSGLGLLGGLGKLFGGFFAEGGQIPAGGWGIAGEAGAEIISGPATVTPVNAINKAMGSMGGSTGNVTHAPTYVLPQIAGGVTREELTSTLEQYDKQSQRTLLTKFDNAKRRYG